MTWTVVARKDFADAVRSRALWGLTALFVLLMAGLAAVYRYVQVELAGAGEVETLSLLVFLAGPATLFVAVATLVVCYKAVAGESESGSGKLLLGLPHTRRDVVVGKFVGRSAVLLSALAAGLLVALVVVVALYADFSATQYAAFAAVTALSALAYVGLYVGLSATTTSTSRATVLTVGAFLVVQLLWDVVALGITVFGPDVVSAATAQRAAVFVSTLVPNGAYQLVVGAVAADGFLPAAGTPFYGEGWYGVVVLVVWAVVPAALGYLRYRTLDL
ncbi:ABC transporter permease [Halosegnis marinus]|uniref:ABC transporter permease n=1 Tax=Halosegnis marinus TaxID=3034023 RepID=A0ABD5ZQA8_9EURY|nr:ABC transporter permease subunit [Halosegnis sp. DT85]